MPYKDPEQKRQYEREYYHRSPKAKERQARWQENNREKQREANRNWYYKNRAKRLQETTEYRKAHPEIARKATAKWRVNNPEKLQEYYENNKEKIQRRHKAWSLAHPEKRKEIDRKSRERNREQRLAREAQRRKTHADAIRAAQEKYRKKDPERLRQLYVATSARRRARKRGLPVFWTSEHLAFARQYFNNRCAICETLLDGLFHEGAADHWIPLTMDRCPGTIPGNMVPLCHGMFGCNNSKADKDPEIWLIKRYGKRKATIILKRINVYFDIVREKFPLPVDNDEQLTDDTLSA